MKKPNNNNKTSNSYVDFQHKTEEAKIGAKIFCTPGYTWMLSL